MYWQGSSNPPAMFGGRDLLRGRGEGMGDEMNRRERARMGVEEGWMAECDGLVEKGGGIRADGGGARVV